MRTKKDWRQRCRERYFATGGQIRARCARRKREQRHPGEVLRKIADGELADSDLTQPHLLLIHRAFAPIQGAARGAFLELLLRAQDCADLFGTRPVISRFGAQPGNTFIDALAALAGHCGSWLRPIADWRPRSHNARRQFSSLVRHLLTEYPPPVFMDSVWFLGATDAARQQQHWFLQIGRGVSPRRLGLPIRFTKRMVHHFLQAPRDYTLEAALVWAHVRALGGNARLVEAILGTRLGTDFGHDEFWGSVIRWLIAHPMLDTAHVGPIVDYIHHRRFEPREVATSPGSPQRRSAGPDYSLKGRTPASLMRQVRQWHVELRQANPKRAARPDVPWYESGIGEFEWTEGAVATEHRRRWAIREILTRGDLVAEGRAMRHCVASYAESCVSGRSSIWSLTIQGGDVPAKRVLTVEVNNRAKVICQARGKANRWPSERELSVLRRWAAQAGLTMGKAVESR